MNNCDYVFMVGKNKGSACNKKCRTNKCCKHSQEEKDYQRKDKRKRRKNNEFLENERLKMFIRRKDPTYREKEDEYMNNYCEANSITKNDLWEGIKRQ